MRKHWIFFLRCGCPSGLVEAVRFPLRGNGRVMTRSEAWKNYYFTARERDAAMDAGVTAELMDHEQYEREVYPKMFPSYRCPHAAVTS
jgi:hypothetical protein